MVGVGFGVVVGGGPRHTLNPTIDLKLATVVELPELPPPQLMISAAARKDSTGTSTRHRRRQIIKPSTMTAHAAVVKPRSAGLGRSIDEKSTYRIEAWGSQSEGEAAQGKA